MGAEVAADGGKGVGAIGGLIHKAGAEGLDGPQYASTAYAWVGNDSLDLALTLFVWILGFRCHIFFRGGIVSKVMAEAILYFWYSFISYCLIIKHH